MRGSVRRYGQPVASTRRLADGRESVSVGALLQSAADTARISRSKLAELTGVSQPSISQYFRGVRPITVDALAALCSALGIDAGDVMNAAIKDQP